MQAPRRCHRGTLQDRRTLGRFWQGLVMLVAFCGASGLCQNTVDLAARNHDVARSITLKEAYLAELRTRHDDLLATREFVRSNAGLLTTVRPLGFGRPGERRIMFDVTP